MTWTKHVIDCRNGSLTLHLRAPIGPSADGNVPLVVLHGFTGSGRDWRDVAAELPHLHVLAPDLPGHGDTRLDGVGFVDAGRVLVAALADIGVERFDLAGYSMGARLALYLALEWPHRVERLILESASPGIAAAAERARRRASDEALAAYALERGIDAFVDRWERTPVLAAEQRFADADRAAQRERRLRCRPEGLAASLRQMGTGAQPWLGDRLHEVAAPTLLLAGGDDAKFVAIATAMHSRLSQAQIEIAPRTGHNVHLEHPAWFAACVGAFLAAARTGAGTALAPETGKEPHP